jgi:hypothetical protein
MSDETELTGGCLCGAVRYSLPGPATHTTVCHCSDCRRASGAPFVAWTFFRQGTLSWTKGSPKVLVFSDRERSFCGDCGTPLKFYDPGIPEWFEMNTCTFDEPEAHTPADECWTEDRLSWAASHTGIPAFKRDAPLPGAL